MHATHMTAAEVQVGDNVWEHNVVTSIKVVSNHQSEGELYPTYEDKILFNGETETPWIAAPTTKVMVTNR